MILVYVLPLKVAPKITNCLSHHLLHDDKKRIFGMKKIQQTNYENKEEMKKKTLFYLFLFEIIFNLLNLIIFVCSLAVISEMGQHIFTFLFF